MSHITETTSSRWLGELPPNFSELRLSHVADAWTSNVDKHSVEDESPVLLCNYTDVYRNPEITSDIPFMAATASRDQIERFRIRIGDTIITKDSETALDIGVPSFVRHEAEDLVCGYHLAIVRPNMTRVVPRFLYWAMASRPVLDQWSVKAAGVTRVGIRSSDMRKASIPFCALDAQMAIADFLDQRTLQIDSLIAEQTRLVEKLLERRSAARDSLAHYVGTGNRLKWSLREVDERSGVLSDELPLMSVSIDWGVRRRDSVTLDEHRADDLAKYKICRPGDIVVNRMRAFQGALGVAPEIGVVSPDYAVLRPSGELDSHWLGEVMRTKQFVGEIVSRIRGIGGVESGSVRTPRINVRDLLDIRVAQPSHSTQSLERDSVSDKTASIDTLVAETRRHIALAKERRSALITAAVTGQIEVRTSGNAARMVS